MSPDSNEHWLELRIGVIRALGEPLADALVAAGALSVTLEDAADDPVLEPAPGETPLWPSLTVVGLFDADTDLERVMQQLRQSPGLGALPEGRISRLDARDWERARLDELHPLRFGERVWVCPAGKRVDAPGAIIIDLDPGLAFGTGTHPTTALCLEWLDRYCRPGDRVIDYGCGSGILAIAAAKLGASDVQAVDIDPQALLATRDNARANGVADRVTAGMPETLAADPVDCLLANILANPLIALAPRFFELLTPGGRLTVSGILREQAEAVAAGLTAAGFRITGRSERGDWVRIDAVRR